MLEPVFKGSSFSPILIFSINFYEWSSITEHVRKPIISASDQKSA
ncbi:hypothetical protein L931_07895 [Helicobacter pylori PZ5024]|uniref:Uncharacterized protein n=1 Tax=Helicobacter pylori PZ5024 TaxID=1337391 RepID=T2T184_HELPX|nr:hypothetical protein L931_07895 [Helicobacter pylori PZ5024]